MRPGILIAIAALAAVVQSCSKNENAPKQLAIPATQTHHTNLQAINVGDSGIYQLLSNTGGTIEVANFSTKAGGTGDVNTYTGEAYQQWQITKAAGGYFTIMNVYSGMYVQCYNYNGTQVLIQAPVNNSDAQLWGLVPLSNTSYKAINKADGLAVTCNGNAMVQLQPFSNLPGQILGYKSVPDAAPINLPVIKTQGTHFVDANGKVFIPWGFQYSNTGSFSLIEDTWFADTTWAKIKRDLKDMKSLGANIVRIHLQYNKYMASATQPNQQNLARLKQLVAYAQTIGIYLDVTGLACYVAADTPPWYDALNEHDRWATQCVFWQAVAQTIGSYSCVMDYDLMNEPVVPGSATNKWLVGDGFAGQYFVQNITLNPAGRSGSAIMQLWIKQLSAAIRQYDTKTLITVGFIALGNVGQFSTSLDYVSTHVYPQTGNISGSVNFIASNVSSKPLVIEEFYPLGTNDSGMASFMSQTRNMVAGYLSYYNGDNLRVLKQCPTIGCAVQYDWINFYMGLNPNK